MPRSSAQQDCLADHTTIGVGGPATDWIVATTQDALVDAVRSLDAAGTRVLVLGGGSNLLVSDAGFPGTVVQVATRGVTIQESEAGVDLTVAAGEPWDAVAALSVTRGWAGIEALSGIPGLVGATPVQNVGAYGQEVAHVVTSVLVLDRRTGAVSRVAHDECGFGYRTSRFKVEHERFVVLDVAMRLSPSGAGTAAYAELARALSVEVGGQAPVADIREAVLTLRRSKGMVLDARDPDTRSLGSFFVNPIVDDAMAAAIDAACPRYPAVGGTKLSAAWLIENAGIGKGWRIDQTSPARVSTKHTLALTNAGGASTQDVIELARAISARVEDRFGIALTAEPRLVDCRL
jgi:UDP-N-acetylmuramate dehydrogenase